jgi:hypothetical protein
LGRRLLLAHGLGLEIGQILAQPVGEPQQFAQLALRLVDGPFVQPDLALEGLHASAPIRISARAA